MPDRIRKRSKKANALASWDNEGGAVKGAPREDRDDLTSLAKEEEHILRCLGAAVIMQWNDLLLISSTTLSMGKLHHTAELRGRSLGSFTSIRATTGSHVRYTCPLLP